MLSTTVIDKMRAVDGVYNSELMSMAVPYGCKLVTIITLSISFFL